MPTTPTPLPKVRKTPIKDLIPHPDNPRRGDIDAIADSLTAHGQYRPIVANTRTGHVLAGNHTLAAAIQLGWTHVQVAWVDVDDDTETRILLADNRTADMGDYDPDALIALLDTLTDTDLGIDGTGYTPSDLAELVLNPEIQSWDTASRLLTSTAPEYHTMTFSVTRPERDYITTVLNRRTLEDPPETRSGHLLARALGYAP